MRLDLAILSDSYSIVGTKECYFSDQRHEVFRYSDTGGIFGEKKVFSLSDNDFISQANPIVVTSGLGDTKTQVFCKTNFRDGNVIFICDTVSGFLNALSNLYPGEKYPLVYLPAILRPAEAGRFAEAFDPKKNSHIQKTWEPSQLSPIEIINSDLEKNFSLPLAIKRVGDRIFLSTLYLDSSELPVSALSVQVIDNKLICSKKLLLGGIQINGFTINFPDSRLATNYVQRLGLIQVLKLEKPGPLFSTQANDKQQESLTSQVKVRGVITGKVVLPFECDADLTTTGLKLRPSYNTAPEVYFDFASPTVAIDGTSDAFLITDNETAIHVSATSESFHHAIQNNRALRSAAHRAANMGPFVATLAGDPVRIEAKFDHLTLFQTASETSSIATSESPILDCDETGPTLKIGSLTLSAQFPMLEGISAAALTIAMIPRVRSNFHECISTLVGLEGKYFTYSILGKLAECHLSIASATATQSSGSMESMSSEYEKNVFLAFVVQNTAQLARDLETTVNYLPAFAIARDVNLLAHAGAPNALCAGTVEQAYQRALGVTAMLASHLYRLEGYISRLTSMRKALAQEDGWGKFVPLGVSAAASLINPFALVGVAQQGVSLLTRNDSRTSMEQDVFADAFDSSSKEWDYIIHSILPSVSYRLCQEIYPIRLSISAILLGIHERSDLDTRERIEMLIAQRFARLTTFLDFPSDFDKNLNRGQVTDFLFQLQKQAEAFGLRHF